MISTETIDISQAVPVQGRGFPMALDARKKRLFMLEKAQQMIDRLQNDLDIAETMGSPLVNLHGSRVGPSRLEFIDLDEIIRLDELEVTTPPVRSLIGVSSQLEIIEAS
jgi:hypothetical protein